MGVWAYGPDNKCHELVSDFHMQAVSASTCVRVCTQTYTQIHIYTSFHGRLLLDSKVAPPRFV